ncbi:MAG: prepilin peptidase [Geitlerinemataceae cyanobacterium]
MGSDAILLTVRAIESAIVLATGCAIGSFLNVVIYRIPAGLSLLWPPSRCPHCLHALGPTENIPVLGWLRLRGRCAHCHTPIPVRYPLVEALTGLLFLGLFFANGATWSIALFGQWMMASWLLALSAIDLDTLTLPNPLTQWGVVAGTVLNTVGAWRPEVAIAANLEAAGAAVFASLVGALVGLLGLDALRTLASIAFRKEAMGAGDSKLMAGIGAWLGWTFVPLTLLVACAIGAAVGSVAIRLDRTRRSQPIPFGPFLAIGALVSAVWGRAIVDAYLQFFLPAA